MNAEEAVDCATQIIDAQSKLLIAYRTGGRTPEKALDTLARERPRFEAFLAQCAEGEQA